jgi:hypothetical protein
MRKFSLSHFSKKDLSCQQQESLKGGQYCSCSCSYICSCQCSSMDQVISTVYIHDLPGNISRISDEFSISGPIIEDPLTNKQL